MNQFYPAKKIIMHAFYLCKLILSFCVVIEVKAVLQVLFQNQTELSV